VPATLSDLDRMHLKATVVLHIGPDGRILSWSFESRSGSAAFDDALERAIRQALLPPPPADMRDRYRSLGLGVRFSI
jgi:TonB family protein